MPHGPLDLNAVQWATLLKNSQTGGAAFIGRLHQRGGMRGAGIGGIIAALMSMIPKFLSSSVGQEIVKTGKNVYADVKNDQPLLPSVKKHARESIRSLAGLGRSHGQKRPIAVSTAHLAKSRRPKRSVRL